LSATVTVNAPGSGSPTEGTVTFLEDNEVIADNVPLVNGTATTQNRNLAIGRHSYTARYNGSGPFAGSTSQPRPGVIRSGYYFAVGTGNGHVQILRTGFTLTGQFGRPVGPGNVVFDFMPYGPGYTGPINVAVGDLTGDGYEELVTGAAVGNP